MDGFTYHNIFQTKGIEYIVIIIFLLSLIPYWVLMNRRARMAGYSRSPRRRFSKEKITIPGGLFFSRNHTWAHLERSGLAKIGLDNLLIHITGSVDIRFLRNAGEDIVKVDLILEMKQQDKMLRIFSPVSGRISRANADVLEDDDILAEDPYGKGWLYEITPTAWVKETHTFFMAEEALEWSVGEFEKFRDFIARSTAKHSPEPSFITLQDGGELADHVLSVLPAEVWNDFQQEFLENIN